LAALVILLAKIQEITKLPIRIKALGALLPCKALKNCLVFMALGDNIKNSILDKMIRAHCRPSTPKRAVFKFILIVINRFYTNNVDYYY